MRARLFLYQACLGLLGLVLLMVPASAQMTMRGVGAGGVGSGGGGGGSPTFAATDAGSWQNIAFASVTATWNNVAFTTGICGVAFHWDQSHTITGVTIGGGAATQAIVDGTNTMAIWYASCTGPTANVVATGSNLWNIVGMVAFSLTNVTALPAFTVSQGNYGCCVSPATVTVTNPATGFCAVVAGSLGSKPTVTWTNVVGSAADFTTNYASGNAQITLAHISATGSVSPTAGGTGYSFASTMVAACWGP